VFPATYEARIVVLSDHFACGRREGFYFTRHLSFTTPFRALNPTILAERLGKLR
jgi:hypothetical protein